MLLCQDFIKVREWIPHIGLLTKVIPLKLFLDIVPSSSTDNTRALCGCFRGGSVYVSFRFISKQMKTFSAVGMSSVIFWLQAKELRLSVCFNTFRNFNGSSNKRQMSPTQTITTEWMAKQWVDKRVENKQTPKHKLDNRINRWSKVQEDTCCPSRKSSLSSNGNNTKGNID